MDRRKAWCRSAMDWCYERFGSRGLGAVSWTNTCFQVINLNALFKDGTRNTHFIFLHPPRLPLLPCLSQLQLQSPSVFQKHIHPFNRLLNLLLHPCSRLIRQNLLLNPHLPQLFPCFFTVYPTLHICKPSMFL